MKNMNLLNICNACHGHLYFADESVMCTEAEGVVIDSRLIEKNFIFVAIAGEKTDGHKYIDDVLAKGALAVICEKLPDSPSGPCILVDNSVKALQETAAFYRTCLDTTVIGITGSVGKTSTKEFVASVLSESFNIYKTEGNFNNTIGVPLTILKIREQHRIAVVEMGINQFGEMTLLSSIAQPDIAIITNIGECHLEFLGDRDGVLKAKTEIFSGLKAGGQIILNGDDDKLITINSNSHPIILAGIDNTNADYTAENIIPHGLNGSTCTLRDNNNNTSFEVTIPLPGKHMIQNALIATITGRILNMSYECIKNGLEKIRPTGGRSNVIESAGYTIIDDCYNANPTSVKSALKLLSESTTDNRSVAILGDMFELGDNEKAYHAEVGRYASLQNIDTLLFIGTLSKNGYEAAISHGHKDCFFYSSVDEALKNITSLLKQGDTILVKASHGMNFSNIISFLTK